MMNAGNMRPERIALFPLNVVLLPGAPLPLHIFEPRYRQMVHRCLEEKSEFGVLASLPKGIVRVGCTAEIVDVVHRYRDGRMDILTVGRTPFRVVELNNGAASAVSTEEDTLLEGFVDYLEDSESSCDPHLTNELQGLFEVCHTLLFDDYPRGTEGASVENLAYMVAAALPIDLLCRQQLLESRREMDRQQRLVAYLRQWAVHLQKEKEPQARARGAAQGLN